MRVLAHLIDRQIEPAVAILTQQNFDHQKFLEFITKGKLRNFVTGTLGSEPLRRAIPAKYADILVDHWKHENLRKSELWDEQRRLLDHCSRSAIPVMVLKGLVLADQLYSDRQHRHQSDLDLLVQRSDLQRSLSLFHSEGFRLSRKRKTISANQLRNEHAMALTRDAVKLDLHWCLRTAPAYTIDDQQVWREGKVTVIDDQEMLTSSDEWTLTLLLVSLAHDIGRAAGRLKHAIDICLFVRSCSERIDWNRFCRAREADGTLQPCLNALAFVVELIGQNVFPPSVRSLIHDNRHSVKVNGLGHSLFLLDQPHRSIHNAVWFCRVYPLNLKQDAKYTLSRILTRPGRVPLLISRVLRRTAQVTKYAVANLLTREPPYPVLHALSSDEDGAHTQQQVRKAA